MASYDSPIRKISTTRSLSLPLESNPIISRISEELKKLKSWEESSSSTAESIRIGLSGTADLYGCVGEFLSLPLTQQSLSLHQNDAFLARLVDGSSKLLEVCSCARGMAVQLKEEASGKSTLHVNSDYFRTRKRVARTAKELRASLIRIERDAFGAWWDELEAAREDDGRGRWRVCAVIGVLRCVSMITVSVLEALASFLGIPPVCNKYSRKIKLMIPLISRLMGPAGEKKGFRNELERADVAVRALSPRDVANDVDGEVRRRLEELEGGMEGILNGLESLSSQLTTTRASLLQIFSF